VRQYYEEGYHPSGTKDGADAFVPTAALVKATLLNATMDMSGVPGYPSDREGWGRLRLVNGLFLPGSARRMIVRDVRHENGLATGQLDEYRLEAAPGRSLKVTMVFTDQPAALGAALTPVNDLDLEVDGPDGLFLGNVFSNGYSATGGAPDNLNSVERVVLPEGGFTGGAWTVRVRAAEVPLGPQGYALHVSGEVRELDGATGADLASFLPAVVERLAQNEPNPFSESTTFRFSLSGRTAVRLAVFDIAGRRVSTLAEGALEGGEYSVRWDGRDLRGGKVAAGIYFYRLEGTRQDGAPFDETRKLVVLR
jgi:hypothetical protein